MFALTAEARVLRVLDAPKGGFQKKARFTVFGERENILSSDIFNAVSEIYNISNDPKDYLFVVVRAVTADTPNSNGDMFSEPELRRFDASRNCQVYQTFQNVPFHVNHQAADRTQARGFIPDCHFNRESAQEKFIEALVAIDRAKDTRLAQDYETGRRDSCSMGCLAAKVQCSICQKYASTEDDLCFHLRSQKMQHVAGKLCYENCFGVSFTELSDVPDPADKKARTIAMLGKLAQNAPTPIAKAASRAVPLIESLDLDRDDRDEILRYFKANVNRLPEGMARLGAHLFG